MLSRAAMHLRTLAPLLFALAACGNGKTDKTETSNTAPATETKAAATAPVPAAAPTPAKEPAATSGVFARLVAFVPPLANAANADPWDVREIARTANDQELLMATGGVPQKAEDAFLLDVKLIAKRDVALGDLDPKTAKVSDIERVIEHLDKTPLPQLRGYRRRAEKLFIAKLSGPERTLLATEALAYLQANGFKEPKINVAKANLPSDPPLVKAEWLMDKKMYKALVERTYGKLVWLYYQGSGSAWMLGADVLPPQPEGPAPTETCSLAVGDKVKAAWSTGTRVNDSRKERYPGKVTEVYGGMAHVKFDDGGSDWAHCVTEIDKR